MTLPYSQSFGDKYTEIAERVRISFNKPAQYQTSQRDWITLFKADNFEGGGSDRCTSLLQI